MLSDNALSRRIRTDLTSRFNHGGTNNHGESLTSFQVASRENDKRVTGIPRLDNSFKEFCSKRTDMGLQ